jgi:hypothetical protein
MAAQNPYKTKQFLKLQKEWQKKLVKSGFEDAEQDEDNLKFWSNQFVVQRSLDSFESKQEYYYLATQFLNDHEFATRRERVIWEYHANGMSYLDIIKTLKKVKIRMTNAEVGNIVRTSRKAMEKLYKITK